MSTIQPSLIADVTLYPFLPPSGVPLIGFQYYIFFGILGYELDG
jgi:hypothetical protein